MRPGLRGRRGRHPQHADRRRPAPGGVGLSAVEFREELLDDPAELQAADVVGLLRTLATAGAQVRELAALGDEADLARLASAGAPRALILATESSLAPIVDLVTALLDRRAGCPVVRQEPDAELPAWVGAADLVVVAGLSRAREVELARLAEAAARRGAALLAVGRPGGTLEERSTWARSPYVGVPRERAGNGAFWAVATPILRLAAELGLIEADPVALAAALDATSEACRPDAESFVNPAKLLAAQLAGRVPVLVADSVATGVVARVVAGLLGRFAGLPAAVAVLPGDLATAAAYLGGPFAPETDDLFRDQLDAVGTTLRLVTVSEAADPAAVAEPARATLRALLRAAETAGVPVAELAVEQPGRLPRLAALLALGGFAAAYLRLGLGLGARPLEVESDADLGTWPA